MRRRVLKEMRENADLPTMTPIQSSILDALMRHGKSNELVLRGLIGNSALITGIALRQLQMRNLVRLSGARDYELSESGVAAMTGDCVTLPRAAKSLAEIYDSGRLRHRTDTKV